MIDTKLELFSIYLSVERIGDDSQTRWIHFWIDIFSINDSALFMLEYDRGDWKWDLLWLRSIWWRIKDRWIE